MVNKERGCNLPLMNLHERVLSVLGCEFVDDVLIDAPQTVTPQMIQLLRIDEVITGTRGDSFNDVASTSEDDRYRYVKKLGIFTVLPSPNKFTIRSIVERIQANQSMFQAKIAKKKKTEEEFYEDKYKQKSKSNKKIVSE